jgi:hypothetical protein
MPPRKTRIVGRPAGHPSKPEPIRTDLDALSAEQTLEPYLAVWQGREWSFIHRELLDTWELSEEREGMTQNEQLLWTIQLALGEEQWEEFKQLPLPLGILTRIYEDYAKHCGVKLGESGGSGGS